MINTVNTLGITPLFNACSKGDEAMVKYLVERGADINRKDSSGKTPLYFAYSSGNKAVINYLIGHGAKSYYIIRRTVKINDFW